jgi:predicted transcriptional regulator of viral defense system
MWLDQGYLHPKLPGVYAVGHPAGDYAAGLAAALLYAGPGAMLSHATATYWLDLLDERPRQIHVTTPRFCRSLPGVVVHERRACERIWHKGLPTTTVAQTLLDLAAQAPLRTVRKALANADYRGILNLPELIAVLGRGRPGSAKLRDAFDEHQPRLARTKSELEVIFFELCEEARMTLPELNVRVAGWEVDALWRAGSGSRSSSTGTATTAVPRRSGATGARRWRSERPATRRCATPRSSSPSTAPT